MIFAQAQTVVRAHGQPFSWAEPNWGWFFAGIIVGLVVFALITHWKK